MDLPLAAVELVLPPQLAGQAAGAALQLLQGQIGGEGGR
jgi:hypothetical protein